MRPGWTTTTTALGLAMALLLGGCSAEEPVFEPAPESPMPSAATQGSPTTGPPEKPVSAPRFIRRWFDEFEAMQRTGDGAVFRSLSRRCEDCDDVADRYEGIYEAGGWIKGGDVTIDSTHRVQRDGRLETWIAEIHATPTRFKEGPQSEVQRLPGGAGAFRLILERASDFHVVELFQEAR